MDRKDYIEPINISSTKKILEQMINSICKIEVNNKSSYLSNIFLF